MSELAKIYESELNEPYYLTVASEVSDQLEVAVRRWKGAMFEATTIALASGKDAVEYTKMKELCRPVIDAAIEMGLVDEKDGTITLSLRDKDLYENTVGYAHGHSKQQRRMVHPDIGGDEEFAKTFNRHYHDTHPNDDEFARPALLSSIDLFQSYADKLRGSSDPIWITKAYDLLVLEEDIDKLVLEQFVPKLNHALYCILPRGQLGHLQAAVAIVDSATRRSYNQDIIAEYGEEVDKLYQLLDMINPAGDPLPSPEHYPMPEGTTQVVEDLFARLEIVLTQLSNGQLIAEQSHAILDLVFNVVDQKWASLNRCGIKQ